MTTNRTVKYMKCLECGLLHDGISQPSGQSVALCSACYQDGGALPKTCQEDTCAGCAAGLHRSEFTHYDGLKPVGPCTFYAHGTRRLTARYGGHGVDIGVRSMQNTPVVFWSWVRPRGLPEYFTRNTYVIVETTGRDGQWKTLEGTRVALLSINGIGEIRWAVGNHSESTSGDYQARDYFSLAPFGAGD